MSSWQSALYQCLCECRCSPHVVTVTDIICALHLEEASLPPPTSDPTPRLFPAQLLQSTINNWQNVKHICICIILLTGTLSSGWTGVKAARAVICNTTLLTEILPTHLSFGSRRIYYILSLYFVFKASFKCNLSYWDFQCKSCRQRCRQNKCPHL